MIRAIIFDFNGIIIDDEPIHMEMFQKVLSEENLKLTKDQYYQNYLAMDDQRCFQKIYREKNINLDDTTLKTLIERKARYYQEAIHSRSLLFPDAAHIIKTFSKHMPLAIASGALRQEIISTLEKEGLLENFSAIISAEDTVNGKPHPECYLLALNALNEAQIVNKPLTEKECIVIEDAIGGIEATHRAGMKCIAVAHTYPREMLDHADMVLDRIGELTLSMILSHNNIA
ncbi:MAG: HAD family phosphatase [Chlamydiota bacterium]|nr:HAD family phosphatase [Chlamydiota bacterium]